MVWFLVHNVNEVTCHSAQCATSEQQVNSPRKVEWYSREKLTLKAQNLPGCPSFFSAMGLFFPPSSYGEWFWMGCSGLQTESQECVTSERKCESFPVIDTSSVCPSLERKDNENCVRGELIGVHMAESDQNCCSHSDDQRCKVYI